MKRWRKYIRESKYLDEDSDKILFDDTIRIFIDIDDRRLFGASSIVPFPGVEQFKEDVLKILEDEYHFEVIEDVYDGILQKGHISNREDSVSIYFDTYFDLRNAVAPMERIGIKNVAIEDDRIFCFIHLRFSDHTLNDSGDVAHSKFLKNNADKYTRDRPDIVQKFEEEEFELDERRLHSYYHEAIQDLRDSLDFRMGFWVKKAKSYHRRPNV